ncbi:dephospho-CoA kinase [Pseudogracilibacillus auburnensis]|uniref:Dephospho-CoA kinase n=1 Tax=Pseudogracilibacillus auburnensis TaxID=1494959 RepID=A0A2V3VWB6_9BACI|nr:dephospho-CoA kinase [Pseudogracilibacillus auburnensis]MBO1004508.1 dephospho-CoA kinase [Pseudogracilibacillus auburnensis]PXW85284.1 dephospho-CoA kinase [Pseudogracilibacillus auburnensis]
MALIIGLTGSIGTGKSTIAKKFREWSIPVVDADVIAREVVEPEEEAYKKIVAAFGEQILQDDRDRTLDRKALGEIVFNDEHKRKKLNEIIHPAIRKEMIRQRDRYIEQGEKSVVLDIPLLYESGLTHFVDKVIVVAVDPGVQLKRIMERDDSTKEEAKRRIDAQIPVAEKAKKADAVIDNNGTEEQSYQQLKDILLTWGVKGS